MAWLPVAAVVPLLAGPARRGSRCEERPLPRWFLGTSQDPSRQEKIQAYEAAQASTAAQRCNAALPGRTPGKGFRLVSYNVHFHRDSQMKPNLSRVLNVLKTLDADVVALQAQHTWQTYMTRMTPDQEAGLPPHLEKDRGRPRKLTSEEVDTTQSLESQMRQVYESQEQEVVGTSHEGALLLEGLHQLGYQHCVYSPGFYSSALGLSCGNAVASRQPIEGSSVVVMDRR
ncbi:unnamed protein product, partial [Durusdinium trenchii]